MRVKLCMTRVRSSSRLAAMAVASLLIPNVVLGCSKAGTRQEPRQPRLVYQSVANPVREMCTDDTESRTEYFNVPVVRFEGSIIRLNGLVTSANDLREWALRKYKNLPEQAVWVQFTQENQNTADDALVPIHMALPRLQIRRTEFTFVCPKLAPSR